MYKAKNKNSVIWLTNAIKKWDCVVGGTGLGVYVYFESTFYRPIKDSLQIFIEAEDQYFSFIHLKRMILLYYTVHSHIKT